MWHQPDPIQFDKAPRMVTANSGITFGDKASMSVIRRKSVARRLLTPAWAMQDETLRRHVMTYLEARLYLRPIENQSDTERAARIDVESRRLVPQLKELLGRRSRAYTEAADANAPAERLDKLRQEIQGMDSQIVMHQRGLLAIVVAVVYRYYRLRENSVQVATELGLLSPAVRQLLWRLNHIGESRMGRVTESDWAPEKLTALFFLRARGLTLSQLAKVFSTDPNVVLKHWNKVFPGIKTPRRRGRRGTKYAWSTERVAKLVEMRQQGMSWAECAFNLESTTYAVTAAARHYAPSVLRTPRERLPRNSRVPSQWTPDRIAEMVTLRQQGLSWKKVALTLGIHQGTVWFAARRHAPELVRDGQGRGPRSGQCSFWTADKMAELFRLREQGMEWREVAFNLGVSRIAASSAALRFRRTR